MEAVYLTADEILAICRRRYEWRGPFYRSSRYRRLHGVGPKRKSEYAAVCERRRINKKGQDWLQRLLAPGSWHGDLCRAAHGEEEESWAAALRLADKFRWNLSRDPDVLDALGARARDEETSIAALKRDALAFAVIHVWQRVELAQTVRKGKDYLLAKDGSVRVLVPYHMQARWVDAWIALEVPKAAAAYVLGTPYPASGERPADALGRSVSTEENRDVSETDTMIAAVDDKIAAISVFESILADARPRERELLEALREADGNTAEAAQRLGIKENNAHQIINRLRKRHRKTA